MIVTAVSPSPDRGGRHRVEFSDGTAMKLLPSVIADLSIYPGRELGEAEMESLVQAKHAADTKLRAVHIISATTVSGRDLEDRLRRKGASEDDAADAVAWLTELNLVDDAEAARQIVARGVRRGYGERRIRQMLYEKKIPRTYWDGALAEMPPMDDAVDEFLRNKLHGQPDEKELKRTVDALMRRGYTWSEIREGLRRYNETLADTLEDY